MFTTKPMMGKKHTKESKQKMSESHKGIFSGSKNPMSRRVLDVDTGLIYETVKEASLLLGISEGYLIKYLKGKFNERAKGKLLKYL